MAHGEPEEGRAQRQRSAAPDVKEPRGIVHGEQGMRRVPLQYVEQRLTTVDTGAHKGNRNRQGGGVNNKRKAKAAGVPCCRLTQPNGVCAL